MLITAIIKSFGPKMTNGVQDTYKGKNGMLYKFMMTIEYDGKEETGEVNSNKTSPTWKTGPKYTMERDVRGEHGQFISYSKLTNTEAEQRTGGFGGGGGANPAFKLSFARQKAVECAFHAAAAMFTGQNLEKMEHFNIVASIFSKWIQSSTEEQGIWYNVAALNIVCDLSKLMPIPHNEGEKMVDAWIRMAETEREAFTAMIQQ